MSSPSTHSAPETDRRSVRDRSEDSSSSHRNTFVVTVAMDEGSARDSLLVGASTLHRRGVEVIEAELCRPAHGRRVFSATFRATDRQAETVMRTFAGQVDVLDADLFRAFDGRDPAVVQPHVTALPAATQGVVA